MIDGIVKSKYPKWSRNANEPTHTHPKTGKKFVFFKNLLLQNQNWYGEIIYVYMSRGTFLLLAKLNFL
jgi:hypothetical protein